VREAVRPVATESGSTPVDALAYARLHWRAIALGLYALAFVIVVVVIGLPVGRDWLVLWLVGALFLGSIGRERGAGRLVFDFLPLVAVLLAYDFLKGSTHQITGHTYTYPQIRFDEWLFGGTVPTVQLQRWFYTPHSPHVWDYLLTLVYLSYFIVPLVVAALVWQFRHQWFSVYALTLVLLAVMALVTYALFPATPPWLAAQQHVIPAVHRVIQGLAGQMHIKMSRAFGSRNSYVNPIAAVPSLHFAVVSSITLFFWSRAKRWRWLLVAYPIAMGLALVYLGEHYVFDLVVGGIYAVIAYYSSCAIIERFRSWRSARTPASV